MRGLRFRTAACRGRFLSGGGLVFVVLACALVVLSLACVRQRCYSSSDCASPLICSPEGECVWQCEQDSQCGAGLICVEHRCQLRRSDGRAEARPPRDGRAEGVPRPDGRRGDARDGAGRGDATDGSRGDGGDGAAGDLCRHDLPGREAAARCPDDMVLVGAVLCVDRYEASRRDATQTSSGTDDSLASSRAGVLPWQVRENATAQAACLAAGKRLCTPAEWQTACVGPASTVYSYGDQYDPTACNGIDAFGPGGYHLAPTGSFPRCTNGYGVFDINGNLWEHVQGGSPMTVRGGAFNCLDSVTYHRCDYVPATWSPLSLGFRCCRQPG